VKNPILGKKKEKKHVKETEKKKQKQKQKQKKKTAATVKNLRVLEYSIIYNNNIR